MVAIRADGVGRVPILLMVIFPYSSPIILNNQIFTENGGATGSFTHAQLQSSYLVSEILMTSYIGTLLLPIIITGTMNYMGTSRLVTDYGYVHQIYDVTVKSKANGIDCTLRSDTGCAFIYDDTFGYIDFRRVASYCNCGYLGAYPPYQISVSYQAGLPTGTANLAPMTEALTILAQIDLNEKIPGLVGMNEGVGDVGIQKFSSMDDYHEERAKSALIRTNLGSSAKAMYAKRLVDAVIKKARKPLLA